MKLPGGACVDGRPELGNSDWARKFGDDRPDIQLAGRSLAQVLEQEGRCAVVAKERNRAGELEIKGTKPGQVACPQPKNRHAREARAGGESELLAGSSGRPGGSVLVT